MIYFSALEANLPTFSRKLNTFFLALRGHYCPCSAWQKTKRDLVAFSNWGLTSFDFIYLRWC